MNNNFQHKMNRIYSDPTHGKKCIIPINAGHFQKQRILVLNNVPSIILCVSHQLFAKLRGQTDPEILILSAVIHS